ncbi:unnamed protein product [Vitrella brassicaformis CCMP3155]|uniref:Uncharacterized protein n=1 Tax=Vitrella brassicaformis (strain CCMP3155) TaxID=1169540 RepID=A0A0G4G6F0_VITBC|nr:unnamed protein product [Vitrella brassicaformis CCMP3155]|eukprot:CEM24040.1 unnamed protein product [Vitrella brassicaformis CCMP3155]
MSRKLSSRWPIRSPIQFELTERSTSTTPFSWRTDQSQSVGRGVLVVQRPDSLWSGGDQEQHSHSTDLQEPHEQLYRCVKRLRAMDSDFKWAAYPMLESDAGVGLDQLGLLLCMEHVY